MTDLAEKQRSVCTRARHTAMPLTPPGPRMVYSVLGAKLVTFKSHSVVSENELRHNPFSATTLINDEMVLTN